MIINGSTKKNTIKYKIGINLFFIDTSAIHSANLIGISFKNGFDWFYILSNFKGLDASKI